MITSIGQVRRSQNTSTLVTSQIAADSSIQAASFQTKLSIVSINTELQKENLPTALSVTVEIQNSEGNSAVGASGAQNLIGIVVGTVLGVIAFAGMFSIFIYYYIFYERKSRDSLWKINPMELKYDSPPILLGRGTFGVVLQAEYRGTAVAVKRVIPPATKRQRLKSSGETPEGSILDLNASLGLISGHSRLTPAAINASRSSLTGAGAGSGNLRENRGTTGNLGLVQNAKKNSVIAISTQPLSIQIDHQTSSLRQHEHPFQSWRTTRTSFAGSREGVVKPFYSDTSSSQEKIAGFQLWNFCRGKPEVEHRKLLFSKFIDEMVLLSKLRHPCITTVMGAIIPNDKKSEPQLVMELMKHGSLFDLLHNDTLILEGDILVSIMRDIVSGMRFLHAADPPVVHGDLKAANVLIDENFKAKVADFGLSQKRQLGMVGTPFWMAPELLRGELCTRESDVYAFGIMMYEIFSRKIPYESEEPDEVLAKIRNNEPIRPEIPSGCPPLVEAMMIECWHYDPTVRPTFHNLGCRVSIVDLNEFTNLVLEKVQKKKDFLAIAAHASRANTVLHDVFPKHVAEALVAGRKIAPESKEVVTIFFSDIVGFTTISSTLPPEKVSFMLDRLYQKFDELSYLNGVFKVETIGGGLLYSFSHCVHVFY